MQYDAKDILCPVSFYSKTYVPGKANNGIHKKELIAIIQAFEEWAAELS